jgi:hypothetical protein
LRQILPTDDEDDDAAANDEANHKDQPATVARFSSSHRRPSSEGGNEAPKTNKQGPLYRSQCRRCLPPQPRPRQRQEFLRRPSTLRQPLQLPQSPFPRGNRRQAPLPPSTGHAPTPWEPSAEPTPTAQQPATWTTVNRNGRRQAKHPLHHGPPSGANSCCPSSEGASEDPPRCPNRQPPAQF